MNKRLLIIMSLVLLPFMNIKADEIPVAILSEDTTTLTFTYVSDTCTFADYKETGIHTLDYYYFPEWTDIKNVRGICYTPIRKVIFDKSFAKARPTHTNYWFDHCYYLDTIVGIEYLNTDSVRDMSGMFEACRSIKSIDLSHFNTKNVTNMYCMFYLCENLDSLDVSNFNTENVTNMESMFYHCEKVKDLDVSKFNTSKVTSMNYMFQGCCNLTELDVSNFNTENVTGFTSMFEACTTLNHIDVSNFKTSKADHFNYMFFGCDSITSLDISNFDTSNAIDIYCFFSHCKKLSRINIGNNDFAKVWKSSQFKYTGSATWPCYLITGENFNDSVLGQPKGSGFYNWRGGWFSLSRNVSVGVTSIADNDEGGKTMTFATKDVDLETQDRSDGTDNNYTYGAKGNTEWGANDENITSGIRRADDSEPLAYQITKVVFDKSYANVYPSTTASWFGDMKNLKEIVGIENLNTSEITSMNGMFYNCTSLKSINLNHFNTSNVEEMNSMFYGCSSMKSIDVSKFNTSKLINAYQMFEGCSSLTRADISNFAFNTSGNVERMFYGCTALKDLILGDNDFKTIEDEDNYKAYNADSAFAQVGTPESPCQLYIGKKFDTSVLGTKSGNYYEWLAGYFKDPMDVAAGISSAKLDENTNNPNAPIYNLSGQRVGRNYKGVVIINGRKVLRR